MAKVCDHTSVGMLVWRDDKLLVIERMKFPSGFAPPAGHVDEHGSHEDAARVELSEEVGLAVKSLKLVIEGRNNNPCRREGGDWHYWKIYEAETEGEVKRSEDETKQARWLTRAELQQLAERTKKYLAGEIPEEEWQENPGLEVVWFDWLGKLGIVH